MSPVRAEPEPGPGQGPGPGPECVPDLQLLVCSRTLFSAICSSIFSTIIQQAPFAIEDLMKELGADAGSDSGRESEEEPGEADRGEQKPGGARKTPQINGD